jgi:hypothetical protein
VSRTSGSKIQEGSSGTSGVIKEVVEHLGHQESVEHQEFIQGSAESRVRVQKSSSSSGDSKFCLVRGTSESARSSEY